MKKKSKSATSAMDVPNQAGIDKRSHDHYRLMDAGGIGVPVNSRPLNDFIQSNHVQTREKYDMKTGSFKTVPRDVVKSTARNTMKLKYRPVTDVRETKRNSGPFGRGMAFPSYCCGDE